MILAKIVLGILFLVIGWAYFFKPNLVSAVNKLARDTFFSDRIILLQRKKLAILFFCMSFVALYMGLNSLVNLMGSKGKNSLIMEASSYMMYMAMQDYCGEKYGNAIQKYNEILKNDPGNLSALRRLAYTYESCGDSAKARMIWQKIIIIDPKNKEVLEKIKVKKNENSRHN